MNLLKRSLAPISTSAWQLIDDEAKAVFSTYLGGRKLVDFDGPHGWEMAAVNTGAVEPEPIDLGEDVEGHLREVVRLIELRVPFELNIDVLDSAARGAKNIELDALTDAAIKIATTENQLIFSGLNGVWPGINQASTHEPIQMTDKPEDYLQQVIDAKMVLRRAGVGGPYGLALGTRAYESLNAATDDGYPVRQVISRAIDGPIVWVPECEGATLLSLRGGDFVLTVGQDLSIGYRVHDRENVELFFVESVAFRVLEPAAAVALNYVK